MQTEDDDVPINSSPPDSQTSSIEGVYPTPSKTSHPFRIIEHDTVSMQSMTSLGRVGRILAGVSDNVSGIVAGASQIASSAGVAPSMTRDSQMSSIVSIASKTDDEPVSGKVSQSSSILTLSGDVLQDGTLDSRNEFTDDINNPRPQQSDDDDNNKTVVLQEPDVIASTKNNGKGTECTAGGAGGSLSVMGAPVAPPRRKKKSKPQTPTDLAVRDSQFLTFCLFR